ncbi:hypothetical protein TIFTF001_003252 [Ficus carica]|uniref:Uncharacterized protein n=1 Tax=Ficus carica TaxID=3494 RepID=A0AA87Z866_FICCA|nr:hypothetical protein TIFTF001_003252 [Ficus carica]
MENNNSIVTREKLDQVAVWLGATVSSAFFSSLERFSCVNLTTDDDDDDDDAGGEHEPKDHPPAQPHNSQNDVGKLPV